MFMRGPGVFMRRPGVFMRGPGVFMNVLVWKRIVLSN